MGNIIREGVSQLISMFLGQVDLVEDPVQPKIEGFRGLSTIEVIDQLHLYLLCHGGTLDRPPSNRLPPQPPMPVSVPVRR